MVFRMKTTLNISDKVMRELKRQAMHQGRTMSELVEDALRMSFRNKAKTQDLPPLPEFHTGGAKVDVANREALYDAMEQ